MAKNSNTNQKQTPVKRLAELPLGHGVRYQIIPQPSPGKRATKKKNLEFYSRPIFPWDILTQRPKKFLPPSVKLR